MKAFKTVASVALTCLIACTAYTTGSAQGRGKGGSAASQHISNRADAPGVGNQGRGRVGAVNNGQGQGKDAGTGNQHEATGNREKGKPGSDTDPQGNQSGAGVGKGNSGRANTGLNGSNHGQIVSARRRAAIEAWKASGQSGPPPWAGVGGGPGGNPKQPVQGQQMGRGHGKGKGKGVDKGHGKGSAKLPGATSTVGLR